MPEKKPQKPARKLGKKDMKRVRGGKQIGNVKYEDIAINLSGPIKG